MDWDNGGPSRSNQSRAAIAFAKYTITRTAAASRFDSSLKVLVILAKR